MSTETNQSDFDRELLSAYVDGELTDAERAAVESRLASDPAVQRQVEEFRRLSGLIQNFPRPTLPADFSAKVLRRAEQGSSSAQVEPQQRTISIGRTWRSWAWAGAALAAALLIALWLPDPREELARRDAPISGSAPKAVPEMHTLRAPVGQVASDEMETIAQPDAVARGAQQSGSPMLGKGKFSVADASAADGFAFGEESRLLIVRVSMPAEALEGGALEHVLTANGIEVATADEAVTSGDAAASRKRDLDRSDASEPEPEAGAALAGATGRGMGGEDEPAEVVLVEAPLEQITACLHALQNDAAIFHTVEIEEDSPLLKQESSLLMQESLGGDRIGEQLRQYNRSAPPALAKEVQELAVAEAPPPEAPLPKEPLPEAEPPSPAPAGEPASAEVALAPAPALADQALARDAEKMERRQLAAKGRAYRYLAPADGRKRALDELTELTRRHSALQVQAQAELSYPGGARRREAGDPPLQVLFVLQSTPPLLAAPVPAEPAAPAEPPR